MSKYQSKKANQALNKYLQFLIDPIFQGVNRIFVLLLKDENSRESHQKYYLPTKGIKNCNVIINWRYFFIQKIKNDFSTYENIQKIATSQGDGYTTRCLLYYPCFKEYYKLTAIDLRKKNKNEMRI